jgi:hypothetical protein
VISTREGQKRIIPLNNPPQEKMPASQYQKYLNYGVGRSSKLELQKEGSGGKTPREGSLPFVTELFAASVECPVCRRETVTFQHRLHLDFSLICPHCERKLPFGAYLWTGFCDVAAGRALMRDPRFNPVATRGGARA